MSTTSASCCCEDTTRANYAVYVKGSNGGSPNNPNGDYSGYSGWNQNSLNLYLNEIDSCVPCSGSQIHGGVTMRVYTPNKYLFNARQCGFPTDQQPEPAWYSGLFIIPYNGSGGSGVLQYFPKYFGGIDDEKKIVGPMSSPPIAFDEGYEGGRQWGRKSGQSIKDFIDVIAKSPKQLVNGEPVKICDCFTDALYTSEDKTEDENFKAVALQALCNAWQVGINAQNIKWKQPIFLGTHDTTVGDLNPGEFSTEQYYSSGKTETGAWPPAQTRFATTLFLPKGWKKDGYTEPTMLNMETLTGKYRDKEFRGDPTRPTDWAPWVQGFSHNTPKTERFSSIRLFLGVLRFAPDGLVGFPFDESFIFAGTRIVELWSYSTTWTDPDTVDWSRQYSEAASRIMSPSTPEYGGRTRMIQSGFASGIITAPSSGCKSSTACGGSGRTGQTIETEPVPTPGSVYTPPKFALVKRPAETEILYAKANIEYATGKDSSLFSISKRNSLVYYTVNNDTPNRCPVARPSIQGKYRSVPGGPYQQGCCCVSNFPTDYDSSSSESGSSVCPSFLSSYTLGFPIVIRGKIGNQKNPYINFYTIDRNAIFPSDKTYSKPIQFYAKYQPVAGCGEIKISDYQHMSTDTVPQAWWCTDIGYEKLDSIFYPKQNQQANTIYRMVSYPEYYAGSSAKLVPATTNGGSSNAFYNCSKKDECPPGGGLLVVVTITNIIKCVTGDNPDPDPEPGLANNVKYICTAGGGGCSISDVGLQNCSWDKSGPFSSSDCLPGSFETYAGLASITTYCDWLTANTLPGGVLPSNNPQEVCCYNESPPPGACSQYQGEQTDGLLCVENKLASPKNNPFIAFTKTRANYGNLLDELGSFFKVKKYKKNSEGGYDFSPYLGENIVDFSSKNYKQSLITNLYGKKLEFGSITLKKWAPILENTYGPYGVDYRLPGEKVFGSSIERIQAGLDYYARIIRADYCDGNLEHLQPEWPQSSIPPSITKSKAPGLNPNRIQEEREKNTYRRVLSERKEKYPTQSGTISDYFAGGFTDPDSQDRRIASIKMKQYWDTRMRWELADAFVLNYDKGITGDYYPEGIPDLQYTNKKIKIGKDGNISIIEVPEYELNWFYIPFETVIEFE